MLEHLTFIRHPNKIIRSNRASLIDFRMTFEYGFFRCSNSNECSTFENQDIRIRTNIRVIRIIIGTFSFEHNYSVYLRDAEEKHSPVQGPSRVLVMHYACPDFETCFDSHVPHWHGVSHFSAGKITWYIS